MANLKMLSALALSAAFAMASPAMAQKMGGFHGGGGGWHGGGSWHGGGMQTAIPSSGSSFRAAPVSSGAPSATMTSSSFRNANASMGTAAPSFGGRSAVVASNGGRTWNGGGWHHGGWRRGYGPGIGFAAGLAAGSALGYGYGGYYDDGYYADNGYYGDPYAYNDGYDTGVVVSSNAADPAYCAQRYRSYDPASNTYLGYDGLRHTCGE